MKKLLLFLFAIAFSFFLFSQDSAIITGKVTDKQTKEILPGATVSIKGSLASTSTGSDGSFIFRNVNSAKVTIIVSYVGYETVEMNLEVSRAGTRLDVALSLDNKMGSEIVVSASKKREKIINAPASIQIIGQKELKEFSGSNVYENFSKVQGLDFLRSGVDYIAINARGFNTPGNNKFFQLIDGRNIMSAVSTGLPLYNLSSQNKEDIETMEIILGPQSALYGPNVYNGLVYITTKDPRTYQGTTVAVSAGNRYQFSARLRQATKINDKWAYKLTGEYAVGKEFKFYDSVYAGNDSFYGPVVGIPERNVDFDFRHIRGEAYLYYALAPKTDLVISGGGSENNFLGVTNGGRNQMKGVRTGFLQARVNHPNYFINLYNAWGNIGSSYSIAAYTKDFWNRTHSLLPPTDSIRGRLTPEEAEIYALRYGNTFKERNQRLNGEAQYNCTFQKAGLFLVAGLSYQKDKPYSHGYTLVDKNEHIHVTQYGMVMQAEKIFPRGLRFSGAIRYDHHSNFGSFYSPKLALIKNAGNGNLRVTWGKAYAMPSIFFQYANFSGSTFGNGPGVHYVPNGTEYPESPNVSPPTTVTTPLKPEENGTWEMGYKGNIVPKIYVDVDVYYGRIKNFISPALPVAGRAISVGEIPVEPARPGTIDSATRILQGAFFNTYFNYGEVNAYGLDAGLHYSFDQHIDLSLKYSWFGSNIAEDNWKNDANKDNMILVDEKSYNAPKQKMIIQLGLKQLFQKNLDINISARYTQEYDFYSGNQIGTASGKGHRGQVGPFLKNFDWGPLGGFTIFDLGASYKLNELMNLNMNITNLFDVRQLEFVGSPPIGRLFMFEVKVHVPNNRKK